MDKHFWLPTRPYKLVDAINRAWLATGSVGNAMAGSHADYNGHHVSVSFKPHAVSGPIWNAEYWWGGRVVLGRGTLDRCLRAAKAEYDRGALGASVHVFVSTDEEAAECLALGFQPWSKELEAAHDATWRDERFAEVGVAMGLERRGGVPATSYLLHSANLAEYRAKIDAYFAELRASRG